jgi:NADH-quinone oxidoreductase subunit J
MTIVFYISALIAVIATLLVITRTNAVHALLYLIVSLLAVAIVLYTLGAPFAAALEVIIYAGAIMVLFVFVVMMLNLGEDAAAQERQWLGPRLWAGPALLSALLAAELIYILTAGRLSGAPLGAPLGAPVAAPQGPLGGHGTAVLQAGTALALESRAIEPRQVGVMLFGPYLLAVELGSMLLLAGLVGAYHLARPHVGPGTE